MFDWMHGWGGHMIQCLFGMHKVVLSLSLNTLKVKVWLDRNILGPLQEAVALHKTSKAD